MDNALYAHHLKAIIAAGDAFKTALAEGEPAFARAIQAREPDDIKLTITVPPQPVVAPAKRVALVVGHNTRAQGAFSDFLGQTEFVFWQREAALVHGHLSAEGLVVEVFTRPPLRSYAAQIDSVAGDIEKFAPDLIVSLHFNSHEDGASRGAEVVVSSPYRGVQLPEASLAANAALRRWAVSSGLRNRGPRVPRKNGGGYALHVFSRTAPTFIFEPFFGSNTADTEWVRRWTGNGHFSRMVAASISDGVAALTQPTGGTDANT